MSILILGGSGATGKLLVEQLLQRGQKLKLVVRATSQIPESWSSNPDVRLIKASVSEITPAEMASYLEGCTGAASCLGHNLTFKGIYGKPRRLVTDAVKLVCSAIEQNAPGKPLRLVLMNTTGNRNRDLKEPATAGEKLMLGFFRLLLPPQADNEQAADYLRSSIGQGHPHIDWVAVRPDSLINQDEVSPYEIHESPTRSAIFNPGKTSRINVADFMARLLTEDELWQQWKGRMPVVYNEGVG